MMRSPGPTTAKCAISSLPSCFPLRSRTSLVKVELGKPGRLLRSPGKERRDDLRLQERYPGAQLLGSQSRQEINVGAGLVPAPPLALSSFWMRGRWERVRDFIRAGVEAGFAAFEVSSLAGNAFYDEIHPGALITEQTARAGNARPGVCKRAGEVRYPINEVAMIAANAGGTTSAPSSCTREGAFSFPLPPAISGRSSISESRGGKNARHQFNPRAP